MSLQEKVLKVLPIKLLTLLWLKRGGKNENKWESRSVSAHFGSIDKALFRGA
jgi:hypothetical protein